MANYNNQLRKMVIIDFFFQDSSKVNSVHYKDKLIGLILMIF